MNSLPEYIILHSSGYYIDTRPRTFHGYTVKWCGTIIGKYGKTLRRDKRMRRGGGYDWCVRLYYNGTMKKWTLQRLIAATFLGNIDGMEVNHKLRNTDLNGGDDIDILTRSQNQLHWRADEKENSVSCN